ncbi:MAG: DUF1178 family protein [Pseudomonadota bacterium]|nr:DUF1178 family protein [Pseudomonadota bacterium]
MIRYALHCDQEHGFEAWFGTSSDYDDQSARGLVECPVCGSTAVRKQIMAPAVAGTKKAEGPREPVGPAQMQAMMMEAAGKVRKHVEENFDYVGDRFAKEARDIHEGSAPERGIYGQASAREVKALVEDGVPVAPLPGAAPPKPKLN